ncbi:S9 family peptidase [Inhella gelatinilytica]|uniref:S9 family peptidase n=1 Tax=Inhella gelatinilytica TaxID=2795030 RepID=A0A931IVL3_9BURK|nr:prolyl oligopeptidase family serine peptidase [Inhella gelatinilytica]MBH9551473.1 S9 family peptidase [Inhella gelatinilytica]
MVLRAHVAALLSATVLALGSASTAPAFAAAEPLTLERLFRAQPYRGEAARDAAFSASGRYVAYRWNPHGEPGLDLYVHDTRTGQTQRLTSPGAMTPFDGPDEQARFARKLQQRHQDWQDRQAQEEAQAAYLRGEPVDLTQWERAALDKLKAQAQAKHQRDEAQKAADKADAEQEKKAMAALAARRAGKAPATTPAPATPAAPTPAPAASAPELKKDDWEWRDELKKQQQKNKLKPEDLYPGVAQFVWAQEAEELVFQYRGALFRWQAGQDKPQLLMGMNRGLRVLAYGPGDQSLFVQDETRVLRLRFKGLSVQTLNRELVHADDVDKKYKIAQTTVSRDGRWMALLAQAPLGEEGKPPPKAGRQVEIMGYDQRFATAKKVDREVSDDKRQVLPTALYIRAVPAEGAAPAAQPEPVFTHKGGDVWFEMSPVVWSRDGQRYTFATWERERELLRVYLGNADEKAKPEVVIERRGDVGHEVVNVLRPHFTPDGQTLVTVLDDGGWRQPYALDLKARQLRALLKGDFEAHQVLGYTRDSRHGFVLANKDDWAAMNVYRFGVADGTMQALGAAGDYHRNAAVSEDGRQAVAVAGHWAAPPELKRLTLGAPAKVLTQSHDPAWAGLMRTRVPERFSFKNRHGDLLQAYVFKPKGWQATDRRPAVAYVYGGPLNDRHSVELDSYQPTAYQFSMYMAERHGYVMVTLDTRGHSNYGRRFSDANWEAPGVPQTEDLEDLHRYMVQNLGVDGARVGLNGWSFGGFQTQHTLFTRPDLYAAGIAGAGPTEWENYNSWYSGRTIGAVDRSKPTLRKYSLLPLAKNLKKPLLLVHGMMDPNVLYQDTVNVYRALLESGKETLVDLFLDPEGEHGMGGAVKTAGWHRKYEAFWLQHLGRAP